MKKQIILIVSLITLAAVFNPSFADANPEAVTPAPIETVLEILERCTGYAEVDEVGAETKGDYLLDCVNEELEIYGLPQINQLPAVEK